MVGVSGEVLHREEYCDSKKVSELCGFSLVLMTVGNIISNVTDTDALRPFMRSVPSFSYKQNYNYERKFKLALNLTNYHS